MKSIKLSNKNFIDFLVEQVNKVLINEASEISLHQQFSKIYPEWIINEVIKIDKSPKKKIAEWILKDFSKGETPSLTLEWYLRNDYSKTLEALVNETLKNEGYQIFAYDDYNSALKAYEDYIDSKPMDPVYSDETIDIYAPENPDMLRNKALKLHGPIHKGEKLWCTISSERKHWWDEYTNNDMYKLYLIHNKGQNKLYQWNSNPNWSVSFKNWENETVSPIHDAQMTEKSLQWISNDSGINLFNLALFEVKEKIFGGKYIIGDAYPEYVGDHWLNLYDANTNRLVCDEFCRYDHTLDVNKNDICLIFNNDWDYHILAVIKNGGVLTKDIENDDYEKYYDKLVH